MLGYAALNVVLMLMYAQSLLGPVPFGLIQLFLVISLVGALAVWPVWYAIRRQGLHISVAAICFTALIALVVFNMWCLFSASAAV